MGFAALCINSYGVYGVLTKTLKQKKSMGKYSTEFIVHNLCVLVKIHYFSLKYTYFLYDIVENLLKKMLNAFLKYKKP